MCTGYGLLKAVQFHRYISLSLYTPHPITPSSPHPINPSPHQPISPSHPHLITPSPHHPLTSSLLLPTGVEGTLLFTEDAPVLSLIPDPCDSKESLWVSTTETHVNKWVRNLPYMASYGFLKIHYIYVLMRDEKEGRKKQARSNKQTMQSNTAHPRQSLENELLRVGLEPTTLYTLDRALYH